MPSGHMMQLNEAVRAIGNALIELPDADVFDLRSFPYKFKWNPKPGKPAMRVKYDGISDDAKTGVPVTNTPASLRFEIQIVHVPYMSGSPDGTEYAQEAVLDGTSAFYTALQDNNTLNDLVVESVVIGSATGPLDINQMEYYGEEIVITCTMY